MLLGRPNYNRRTLVTIICILASLAFIYHQWGKIISKPNERILRLGGYLSTPTSSIKSGTVLQVEADADIYHEVYSVSTSDMKYFFIDFVDHRSINPNIIPHPYLDNTWVIVAQRHDPEGFDQHPMVFAEITCNAVFQNGALRCFNSPSIVPVETPLGGDKCEGNVELLNLNNGPHDARVFYGPKTIHIVYGANSQFTCFGQFVQNFGWLIDWGYASFPDTGEFENATEIQRPPPYGTLEKNFFLFWDSDGHSYVHYDVSPRRSFAALALDGTVGEDLAPHAAVAGDDTCIEKYMPPVAPEDESIHQATNSLSVTMCKRQDPSCEPGEQNTFAFTIFQHKRFRSFHSVYEPYVMVFKQQAPFKVHGISKKPFWIHGRWKPSELKDENIELKGQSEGEQTQNWSQTEMFYITSMSWKSRNQKYQGYIDDVLFLGFGIEDMQSAGIDVVVGDLLMDLGLC